MNYVFFLLMLLLNKTTIVSIFSFTFDIYSYDCKINLQEKTNYIRLQAFLNRSNKYNQTQKSR